MADKYSIHDIANAVRKKYAAKGVHTFDNTPDDELVKAYTSRFPEYRDMVDWLGQAGIRTSAAAEPNAMANPTSFMNTPGLGTGVKPGDWLVKLLTGKNRQEYNEGMGETPGESPTGAFFRTLGRGLTNKAADTVSGLTTPASAALTALGLGANTKAIPALAESLLAPETAAAVLPAATAAERIAQGIQAPIGAAVGGANAYDTVKNLPGALRGEPDAVERALEGGAGVAGGLAMSNAGAPAFSREIQGVKDARTLRRAGSPEHELGRKSLADILGTTDFETGAPSADALDHRALERIVNGVGGVENLVSNDPTGLVKRLGEGGLNEAAKQAEFVHANYINQNPNAPTPIAPIADHLRVFLTSGLGRNNPQLAAAIEQALRTGVMPASDAYALNVEMNKYYKPGVLEGTDFKRQDALAVGNHLRQELGTIFGPEFSAENAMQGRISSIAHDAMYAGNKASLTPVPPKLKTVLTPSERTLGVGGVALGAGATGYTGAEEYLGAATLLKYLHDIYQNSQNYPSMHPDLAAAKALQSMEFSADPYGARPTLEPEVAANLRQSPEAVRTPVAGGTRPGQNITLGEPPTTTLPDPRFSPTVDTEPIGARPEAATTPTAGRFADVTPRAPVPAAPSIGQDPLFWRRRAAANTDADIAAAQQQAEESAARTGLANSRLDIFDATSPRRTQLALPAPAEPGVARTTADYGPAPVQGGGVGVDPDTGAVRGLSEPLPPMTPGLPMPKSAISASNIVRNTPEDLTRLRSPTGKVPEGGPLRPLSAEVPPPPEQAPYTLQRLIDAFTQRQRAADLEMERPLALVPTSSAVEDNPFHFLMPDAQVPPSGLADTPNPPRLVPEEQVPNSVPAPALPPILRPLGKR